MSSFFVSEGYINLGFQELSSEDFRKIILKLGQVVKVVKKAEEHEGKDHDEKQQQQQVSRNNKPSPRSSLTNSNIGEILYQIGSKYGGGGGGDGSGTAVMKNLYLNLHSNPCIGDTGMEHLYLLADFTTTLAIELNLGDCGLTPRGIQLLCEFLKTNTTSTIKGLILWGNDGINDEGAEYLADMLCSNTTLTELCLSENRIGLEGMQHLARGLRHNNNVLQKLSLSNMAEFTDSHLKELCDNGIAINQGLRSLNLLGNRNIREQGLSHLERALRTNYSLEQITISDTVTATAVTSISTIRLDNEDDYKKYNIQKEKEKEKEKKGEEEKEEEEGSSITTWNKIFHWMHLNKMGRSKLFARSGQEEVSQVEEWEQILLNCHRAGNINSLYYFLRYKPDLCQQFHAAH